MPGHQGAQGLLEAACVEASSTRAANAMWYEALSGAIRFSSHMERWPYESACVVRTAAARSRRSAATFARVLRSIMVIPPAPG